MESPTTGDRLRDLTPGEAAETREHLRAIAHLRRTQARIDGEIAKRTARLAEIAHRQGSSMGGSNGPEYARRSMAAELAAATNTHPASARAHMETSERLIDGFPATAAALREGRITQRHARVVLDAGANLDQGRISIRGRVRRSTPTPRPSRRGARQASSGRSPRSGPPGSPRRAPSSATGRRGPPVA